MAFSNSLDRKKILSITNKFIENLESGLLFKTILSKLMQWSIVFFEFLIVLGIFTTAYSFSQPSQRFESYSFMNFIITLWNIAVLIAFGIAIAMVLINRSKKVIESPEGRIIPLVAQVIRCYGELIALAIITMGLSSIGGMFGSFLQEFTPFGGIAGGSQGLVQTFFGYGTFSSFICWIFVVLISILIAILVLAGAYFTAEVTMLLVDIAENTRKPSKN